MQLIGALAGTLFGGGAAATGAISATLPMAGGTLGGGLSIASILQGGASVLGVVSSIAAGAADADTAGAAAIDAEREAENETLKGIERKRSLTAALAEAIGEADAAHAASGVDLSFGSARQARKATYREADLAGTTDGYTTSTRINRLFERARSYRRTAKRAMTGGIFGGLPGALKGFSSILQRG